MNPAFTVLKPCLRGWICITLAAAFFSPLCSGQTQAQSHSLPLRQESVSPPLWAADPDLREPTGIWSIPPPHLSDARRTPVISTVTAPADTEVTESGDEEEEQEEESTSSVVIASGYSSHNQWLGRDDGIRQYSFTPSVAYHHRSGIFVSLGTIWLSEAPGHWNETDLAIGWDLSFSDRLGLSLAYTHSWFTDSTTLHSLFNNNLGVGGWYNAGIATVGGGLSLDFGENNAVRLALVLSREWEVPVNVDNLSVTLGPSVTAWIGQQDTQLAELRKQRGKKKGVTPVVTNAMKVFSVMDYELSLPVTFTYGSIAAAPSLTYVIPANVLDGSDSSPFVVFGAAVSVTVR